MGTHRKQFRRHFSSSLHIGQFSEQKLGNYGNTKMVRIALLPILFSFLVSRISPIFSNPIILPPELSRKRSPPLIQGFRITEPWSQDGVVHSCGHGGGAPSSSQCRRFKHAQGSICTTAWLSLITERKQNLVRFWPTATFLHFIFLNLVAIELNIIRRDESRASPWFSALNPD